MKKRILSAFLVLCMMLTMVPTAALAAEDSGGGSDRVHTESNDGVVVDKTVNYDEDGNYSLTLEAYVTNEVTKGSKTTPLDIVLVLDVSGSMDDDLGESTWEYTPTDEQRWSYSDINGSRWTTYYFRDDDGNYYEVEAESDGSLGNRQYSIGYYTGSGFYRDWNQLGTTSRNQNANLWTGTLYTRQEITTSKMEAMQSAVNGFIDQVAENAAGADNDVTHRISIVKFADDSYADSVGNDRQDDYYAYNYTQIVKDFTTVDAAGVQQLTGAIEALEPAGATSVDYGLTLAQDVLDGQWRHDGGEWWVEDPTLTGARQDAKQVVVVFTDGEPSTFSNWSGGVAANAVNLAKDLNEQMLTRQENARATVNEKGRQLEKEVAEFERKVKNNAFLSQERFEQEQQRLLKKQQELQAYAQQLENELLQEQQKMLIQVTDSITNFIKEYNKDGRYEAILNNSSVLYIKPSYNITPEITRLLNNRYTSKQK